MTNLKKSMIAVLLIAVTGFAFSAAINQLKKERKEEQALFDALEADHNAKLVASITKGMKASRQEGYLLACYATLRNDLSPDDQARTLECYRKSKMQ